MNWRVLGLLLLMSCASAPGPRSLTVGAHDLANVPQDFPTPTPSWPTKLGAAVPPLPPVVLVRSWLPPTLPSLPSPQPAVALAASAPVQPLLPLPEVLPLPTKQTPVSRSWTVIAQVKPSVLPLPAPPPTPVVATKTAPKAETKAPATVSAQPQQAVKPVATPPPTAAATASLLPTDKTTGQDFRWQDVNAVAGDAVTLHFDKTAWLYLDTPAQQKVLGFQSINRDKDSTTFQFKPTVVGQYTLEFQRQDLVNQSTDVRKVRLNVVAPGTRTSTTGTVLAPQTTTSAVTDALEASRQLVAAGKTAEAVQRLLQSYKADDMRVNLELARLLDQTGQDDQALSYLDKNLTLTGPDFQSTLELGTRLAATQDAQKKLPTYVKLWNAGTTAPPEELYLQVLETLRTQKLPETKEWSARYASWYPAPKLRDRYLFQLGQALEEPGDGRDVKGAWKAYNEVVESYPLSPFWKAAGERAAYLNRHFLQVR